MISVLQYCYNVLQFFLMLVEVPIPLQQDIWLGVKARATVRLWHVHLLMRI